MSYPDQGVQWGAVQSERAGKVKEEERDLERVCSHPLSHPPAVFPAHISLHHPYK